MIDLTSSWFLLLIIVLGGAVALLADKLGRTFGKKRLRLGSMRPRHTAMVFTALTGAFVTLITILLVSALSAEVREWIVRGRGAVREARIFLDQLTEVQKNYDDTQRRMNMLLGDVKKLEAKLKAQEDELKKQEAALAKSNESLALSRKKVASAEGHARELRGKVGMLNAQVKKRSEELSAARSRLSTLRAQIEESRSSMESLIKNRNELFVFSEKLERELQNSEKALQKTNNDLQDAKKSLAEVNEELRTASDRYNEAVANFQRELEVYTQELERAQQKIQLLSISSDNSRDAPMIFSRGEELVRVEILEPLNEDQAAVEVRRIIAAAKNVALNKGAAPNDTGSPAGFAPYTLRDSTYVTIDMQFNAAVKSVASKPGPKLLVAVAGFNAFMGEFVALDVLVFDNPIVFKAGEFLGEGRVNGNGTEQQVLTELTELLRTKVRAKAIEKKMIQIGGQPQLGQISPNEVVPLINSIRNFGRQVRVLAYAKEDTRAAGPLNVEFKLR